jgi:hypothetical protein
MNKTARRAGALMVAGMLSAGLGACGDDDDEAGTSNDTASEDAAADTGEFCDAAVEVDAANMALESGESSPEDVDAAMQEAEDSAPDEIAEAVGTMVSESKALAAEAEEAPEGEGPPPIPSDEFFAASAEVGGYLGENCDLGALDVTATEYAFDGIPEEVQAGTTLLTFTNDGTEFHEAVLMQIAEGEERSFEELMALPEEESMALVTNKAFVFTPPDTETYVTAELDPGRYVAICFVPTGATPEALETGATLDESDGHFMHGMVTEFQVT